MSAAPGAEQEPERTSALAKTHILERRQLVDGRHDQRSACYPATGTITLSTSPDTRSPTVATAKASTPMPSRRRGTRTRKEAARSASDSSSCSSRGRPSERLRGTSSPPSSRSRRQRTIRAFRVLSTAHRPCPASRPPSTTSRQRRDRREGRSVQAASGQRRQRARVLRYRKRVPGSRRSTAQAAHENGADSPVFPSYSMPKALICDRVASAAVNSEPTGWNTPTRRAGSPVSMPNGTMSSTSKSIESPIRTLWRRPGTGLPRDGDQTRGPSQVPRRLTSRAWIALHMRERYERSHTPARGPCP